MGRPRRSLPSLSSTALKKHKLGILHRLRRRRRNPIQVNGLACIYCRGGQQMNGFIYAKKRWRSPRSDVRSIRCRHRIRVDASTAHRRCCAAADFQILKSHDPKFMKRLCRKRTTDVQNSNAVDLDQIELVSLQTSASEKFIRSLCRKDRNASLQQDSSPWRIGTVGNDGVG